MISWPLFFSIVILAGGAPIIAAILRSKQVSHFKLYLFLVSVVTLITFFVVSMPEEKVVNHDYTWFCFFGVCFATPWVLLVGFAIGNFAFLCLWALIKYGDR
jgi:hypothetical protein